MIYIAGNHEFYGCDIDRTIEKAKAAAAGTNLYVLQNDSATINGITFIGATRIITNGKGYGPSLPRESTWDNPQFHPNLIIEI